MKKTDLLRYLRIFSMPVLMVVLGLILLLSPDTAAVVIARIISFVLTGSGIVYGLYGFLGGSKGRVMRLFTAVFCLTIGSALAINPLILAANIGRVLGILLAVEGIQNLTKHSVGKGMALLTLVGAVVLVMAPMTASRLVFSLCGLILLCIGAAQLLERIRRRRLWQGDDDPNIIDAL